MCKKMHLNVHKCIKIYENVNNKISIKWYKKIIKCIKLNKNFKNY